jgi:flagellar hook-basal body complex protein FliE
MKVENLVFDNFTQNDAGKAQKSGTASFSEVLKDSIDKVGQLEKEANEQTEKLANVGTQDVHNTMIAVEKADISFQLMMQIRNKIIDAYQEIMKIQV